MNKLRLIIAREYLSIVGRKSFIIMTLLIPMMMLLIAAIPAALAWLNDKSSDTRQVAVIDETGRYAGALHDTEQYQFVALRGDTATDARAFYDKAGGSLDAVVIIPRNVDSTAQVNIYSEATVSPSLINTVTQALTDTIEGARLAASGIPGLQQLVADARINLDVRNIKWSDGGEQESSTGMAMALGFMLAFITYMFVLMYGAMIMNSVIEEKTNRIVEVVVSSCRPFQLMLGKIIGVGLVGLTQMAIWTVMLGVIALAAGSMLGMSGTPMAATGIDAQAAAAVGGDASGMAAVVQQALSINYLYILGCFVLYFLGGYLLYGSLFAGFGSAVDQASDSSQFTTPVILIMVIALYAGLGCMGNPSGQPAVWCSIIPFTSPVVMMIRLPFDVPAWQLALSIGLLFVTALAMVWLAARIYRRGILHYGKKTTLGTLLRWLK